MNREKVDDMLEQIRRRHRAEDASGLKPAVHPSPQYWLDKIAKTQAEEADNMLEQIRRRQRGEDASLTVQATHILGEIRKRAIKNTANTGSDKPNPFDYAMKMLEKK